MHTYFTYWRDNSKQRAIAGKQHRGRARLQGNASRFAQKLLALIRHCCGAEIRTYSCRLCHTYLVVGSRLASCLFTYFLTYSLCGWMGIYTAVCSICDRDRYKLLNSNLSFLMLVMPFLLTAGISTGIMLTYLFTHYLYEWKFMPHFALVLMYRHTTEATGDRYKILGSWLIS